MHGFNIQMNDGHSGLSVESRSATLTVELPNFEYPYRPILRGKHGLILPFRAIQNSVHRGIGGICHHPGDVFL